MELTNVIDKLKWNDARKPVQLNLIIELIREATSQRLSL